MDVKIAFLNSDLEEEFYANQLECYVIKGKNHKVCKLNKSFYGRSKLLDNDIRNSKLKLRNLIL